MYTDKKLDTYFLTDIVIHKKPEMHVAVVYIFNNSLHLACNVFVSQKSVFLDHSHGCK